MEKPQRLIILIAVGILTVSGYIFYQQSRETNEVNENISIENKVTELEKEVNELKNQLQNTQNEDKPSTNTEDSNYTNEFFSSAYWGPEDSGWGAYYIFSEDNTFTQMLAYEGGDRPLSGTYKINDNEITLYHEKYGEMDIEEAIASLPNGGYLPSEISFTVGTSDLSLYLTTYITDGNEKYWKQDSYPNEKSIRYLTENNKEIEIYTTQEQLKPKEGTIIYQYPEKGSNIYIIKDFSNDEDSEINNMYNFTVTKTLDKHFNRVLGRTTFQENDDYYYLVDIQIPWYGYYNLIDSDTGEILEELLKEPTTFYIHGSDLELK